jgi:hypothetical protein
MIMFALSYTVHFLAELGMTSELITATFYKRDNDLDKFKYSNMLVVLLTLASMYFIMGSTLEYTRKSWFIVGFLTFLTGGIKIGVSSIKSFKDIDGNILSDSDRRLNKEFKSVGAKRRANCTLGISQIRNNDLFSRESCKMV